MFITHEPIEVSKFLSQSTEASCGAVASFVGVVRNHHEGKKVEKLFYECYELLAEKSIGLIVDSVKRETRASQISVIHRVGLLEVGAAAVAVWVSAEHRREAFEACRAVIDQIKHRVPIWKKEFYPDGSNDWVLCSPLELASKEVLT